MFNINRHKTSQALPSDFKGDCWFTTIEKRKYNSTTNKTVWRTKPCEVQDADIYADVTTNTLIRAQPIFKLKNSMEEGA